MATDSRTAQILQIVEDKRRVTIRELSQACGISAMSVRRHLARLEKDGFVIRTHGGAVLNRSTTYELSFGAKTRQFMEEKQRMGLVAAGLIKEGDSVILDAGTSVLCVAQALGSKRTTVITPALEVVRELVERKSVSLIMVGGLLRRTSVSLVGPIAERTLREFNVDKAFVGVEGITLEGGISVPDVIEAELKRTMVTIARQVIVVADHTKFGINSLVSFAPIDRVHTVVTDNLAPEWMVQGLREKNIEVLIA